MARKVHARVTLTLNISLTSTWGEDIKADQVWQQAVKEAIGACRQGLVIDGLACRVGTMRFEWSKSIGVKVATGGNLIANIVGDPKVTAIIVDDE